MKKLTLCALLALTVAALTAAPASADHSWGSYHWAQASTASPDVNVTLGDNLVVSRSTNWPALFDGASASSFGEPGSVVHDWSNLQLMPLGTGNAFADILDTPQAAGLNANPKRCKPYSDRVEVCNARYGYNGWLGVAQIWISGGHIVKGTAKVNDSYLDGSRYTVAAKQHVLCQEVGHTFGLDHQDEAGADLDTCMDYADAFDNPHPDDHDNEQINTIYSSHTDRSTASTTTKNGNGKGSVRRLEKDLYVEQLPGGGKVFTFVTWKSERAADAAPDNRIPE